MNNNNLQSLFLLAWIAKQKKKMGYQVKEENKIFKNEDANTIFDASQTFVKLYVWGGVIFIVLLLIFVGISELTRPNNNPGIANREEQQRRIDQMERRPSQQQPNLLRRQQ